MLATCNLPLTLNLKKNSKNSKFQSKKFTITKYYMSIRIQQQICDKLVVKNFQRKNRAILPNRAFGNFKQIQGIARQEHDFASDLKNRRK